MRLEGDVEFAPDTVMVLWFQPSNGDEATLDEVVSAFEAHRSEIDFAVEVHREPSGVVVSPGPQPLAEADTMVFFGWALHVGTRVEHHNDRELTVSALELEPMT